MNTRGIWAAAARAVAVITVPVLMTMPVVGQGFGAAKEKVTLQRKLPALIQLPGDTIRVKVTGHADQADLVNDLQAQLETELLKDDPHLRREDGNPAVTVSCEITNYAHPRPIQTRQAPIGNQAPQVITRITGSLSVTFQARSRDGRALGSDNVSVNYDQQFNAAGNNISHGIMGTMSSSWHKLKGNSQNGNGVDTPPTDAELRSLLLDMAVHRMAENIVNTNEAIEVFLAKNKGAIDEGDKAAEAGLWERALETFETAAPLTKKDEDAYRLYNIGVANEALGYRAEDAKSAMKFLDEAAINYGKAIDAKPGEKYFLEPQKRIETAIAHYKKLEDEKNAPPPPPPPVVASATTPPPPAKKKAVSAPAKASAPPPSRATKPAVSHATGGGSHALTDSQVIAMVKNGIDDDTVMQAVHNAKTVDFDLSSAGQRRLTAAGVTPAVLSAMKARAAQELANQK